MNDGIAVEFIHGGHDARLELLLGCDADVAQDRASERRLSAIAFILASESTGEATSEVTQIESYA